jgi:integrase/recombinase XerD
MIRDICSESKVRIYQSHLVQTKKLAPGSVGVHHAALRFPNEVTLKRGWVPGDIPMPTKPFKLPALLSPEEVTLFLAPGRQPQAPAILTTTEVPGRRVSGASDNRQPLLR